LLLGAALVLALVAGEEHRDEEAPFRVGAQAPRVHLRSLDDREIDLRAWGGQVVVLNFWATWCEPCVAEMPALDRLERALDNDGLVVLAVSVDESPETVRNFARDHHLSLPLLLDPGGQAARAFGVVGYPTTFVLDASGRLREHYLGPAEWDQPEALDHFRALISSRIAPTR
jgi:peroxiredoxin